MMQIPEQEEPMVDLHIPLPPPVEPIVSRFSHHQKIINSPKLHTYKKRPSPSRMVHPLQVELIEFLVNRRI
jgi:hypothetical protein